MSIVDTIKEHPIAVGGAVLVVILLMSRGGGAKTGNAEIIAASLESQRIASGLNAQLSSSAADVVKANTAARAEMYTAGLAAGTEYEKLRTGNELALYATYMQGEQNARSVDASRAVGLAQIDAGKVVSLANNETAIRLQSDQIAGAQRMTELLVTADQAKRNDQFRSDQQFLSFQNAGLATMLQHDANLAHLSAGTALAQAQIAAGTTIQLAQIDADQAAGMADLASHTAITLANLSSATALEQARQQFELDKFKLQNERRVNNVNSWVKASESANNGALKWFGMSGFSDRRLKENVRYTGLHTPRGFPLYTYNFIGSATVEIGVMADEVQALDPTAVAVHESGYLVVDYSRV